MSRIKHKVFISYHHALYQHYKERLVEIGHDVFIDASVDTGGISDTLNAQAIREEIRDNYLRDSTVTILLVGTETKHRKHVDWELYSSMHDGKINKKSGILVINLPSAQSTSQIVAGHEEQSFYSDIQQRTVFSRNNSPYLPERILDNLVHEAKISVTNWDRIEDNMELLRCLIEMTYKDRATYDYDLSRPMMRANISPQQGQGFSETSQSY